MKHLHLTMIVLAGLFAAGCREEDTPMARPVIGVSVLTLTNPFFQEIADNLREEAAKHGYDVVVVSGEFDAARQQNQVKDFIVQKVAAIVLCPCESKAIGPAIQEANDAGIAVCTCDIACLAPGARVVCHIATDNYEGGKQAARAMLQALGDAGGKVAILHFEAAESCLLRVKGFREMIKAHNEAGGTPVNIVAELPCGGVKDQGYKAAEDLMQSHPDLAGIFAINDPSALGARAALEKADKDDQVVLVGFDGQPEGKQAIQEGKIYADPVQYPDRIGRETARVIVDYFEGEKVPAEILIPTGLYRRADALKN
ncbi:MAG TPA: substrate-binding domain-containing protein [Gemmataceae bacterium]|nr:substrate-binding domain-containing protein [Gemmataceae bacterium]